MASGLGGALSHASTNLHQEVLHITFPWALSVQALVINQLSPRMMAALTSPLSPQHQAKSPGSRCGTRQTGFTLHLPWTRHGLSELSRSSATRMVPLPTLAPQAANSCPISPPLKPDRGPGPPSPSTPLSKESYWPWPLAESLASACALKSLDITSQASSSPRQPLSRLPTSPLARHCSGSCDGGGGSWGGLCPRGCGSPNSVLGGHPQKAAACG